MIAFLLALLPAQDLGPLLERLGDDDVEQRDRAVEELSRRGPEIVPPLLELHRAATSPETKARTEKLLQRHAFAAMARTRPDEPLRETLKLGLLKDVLEHRAIPGCTELPEGAEPPQRILRQDGSGHGQFLAIDELTFGKDGATIRRVAFQGRTPYRPKVTDESVRAEEATLDAGEAAALAELVRAGCALRRRCARPMPRGRVFGSSASFSLRFRVEFLKAAPCSAAYTGYLGTLGQPDYAHGRILDALIDEAFRHRAWTPSELGAADRARSLAWVKDAHAEEAWWVREHYLDLARHLGDAEWLPYLDAVEKGLDDKEDASEKRQLEAIADARKRIAARR